MISPSSLGMISPASSNLSIDQQPLTTTISSMSSSMSSKNPQKTFVLNFAAPAATRRPSYFTTATPHLLTPDSSGSNTLPSVTTTTTTNILPKANGHHNHYNRQPYGHGYGSGIFMRGGGIPFALPSPSPSPNNAHPRLAPTFSSNSIATTGSGHNKFSSNGSFRPPLVHQPNSATAAFDYNLLTASKNKRLEPLQQLQQQQQNHIHRMAISSPRIINYFQQASIFEQHPQNRDKKLSLSSHYSSSSLAPSINGEKKESDSYKHFDGPIFGANNKNGDPSGHFQIHSIKHIDDQSNGKASSSDLIEFVPVEAMDWLGGMALTRLTNLLELYSSSSTISQHSKQTRLVKRLRNFLTQMKEKISQNGGGSNENCPPSVSESHQSAWGMSLSEIQAKTVDLSPLPRFVHEIIAFLDKTGHSVEGIFRKNGSKPRILEIKDRCSRLDPSQSIPTELLTESQPHDVADALKQYFRDLPECLMTDRVSEIIENCVVELPENKHFAAIHFCILVMPPENREALMVLLKFLNAVASNSDTNQMTAQNLATCFMPTLFRFSEANLVSAGFSFTKKHLRRRNTIAMPNEREMRIFVAIKQVLALMISNWESLLHIPASVIKELQSRQQHTVGLGEIPMPFREDQFLFTGELLQGFKKQHRTLLEMYAENLKHWNLMRVFPSGAHLYTRYINDLRPLKMFRVEIDMDAPTNLIQASILHNRHFWDNSICDCRKVRSNCGQNYDVVRVTHRSSVSQREKWTFLARRWSYGVVGEPATIIERSIVPPRSVANTEGRLTVYKSSFLIVPQTASQSKLIYLTRIDLRGKDSLWYDRVFGELIANQLARFKHYLCHHQNSRGTLV